MKLSIKLFTLIGIGLFLFSPKNVLASPNPTFYGVVMTRTGTPIAGASITQKSGFVPVPAYCEAAGTDENGNPTGQTCYPEVLNYRTTMSSQNGFYEFPPDYRFQCSTSPQLFNVTIPNGICHEISVSPSNIQTSSEVNIVCDITGQPPFSTFKLSGVLFSDNNSNFSKDVSEQAFGNELMQLLNSSNNVISEVRTNATGNYEFTILNAGNYRVKHSSTPAGFNRVGSDSYPLVVKEEVVGGVTRLVGGQTR